MKKNKKYQNEKAEKKMLKSANGITLIALVITIIVLLILAGVTIAMLTGQNGILTNATNANSSSVYHGAEEQVKLAYMSVRTQIMTEKVANSSYDATQTTPVNNVEALKEIVKKDLNAAEGTSQTKEFGVAIATYPEETNKSAIKIVYKNTKIYKNTIATGKPSKNSEVEYYITLEKQSAGLIIDGETIAVADTSSGNGSGNQGGGNQQTGELTGVDFGSKTATTIEVGEDLTIGTENFRVLKTDKSSQIIAVPFYNITLVTPEDNDGAYPEQTNASSGNVTTFATEEYWTEGTDTIDMTDSRNNIQKYITAYSSKLSNVTNGKVTARVARYASDMQYSVITLPKGSTVTREEIRNPGQIRPFWTGSSDGSVVGSIHGVTSSRWL